MEPVQDKEPAARLSQFPMDGQPDCGFHEPPEYLRQLEKLEEKPGKTPAALKLDFTEDLQIALAAGRRLPSEARQWHPDEAPWNSRP